MEFVSGPCLVGTRVPIELGVKAVVDHRDHHFFSKNWESWNLEPLCFWRKVLFVFPKMDSVREFRSSTASAA